MLSCSLAQTLDYSLLWLRLQTIHFFGLDFRLFTSLAQTIDNSLLWLRLQTIHFFGLYFRLFTSLAQTLDYSLLWLRLQTIHFLSYVSALFNKNCEYIIEYLVDFLELCIKGFIITSNRRHFPLMFPCSQTYQFCYSLIVGSVLISMSLHLK